MTRRSGEVRDAILVVFAERPNEEISTSEIHDAIRDSIGEVPPSSVRSFPRLNTPQVFERTGCGKYKPTKKTHDCGVGQREHSTNEQDIDRNSCKR